jgi:zinc transport system substrate-binding protein
MVKFSKFIALLLMLALMCVMLFGCSGASFGDGKIKIVCSVFPEYDWVRNIVGDVDGIEVALLVANGQELHSYEASPADVVSLKESDLVISVGGVSDKWISEAIADEDGVKHMRLTEISGMSLYNVCSDSTDHALGSAHDHEHEHTSDEIDEHVWLSPKNAMAACRAISEELCVLDSDNAEKYKNNLNEYLKKLEELDARMTKISTGGQTILFADRFPFVYLLEEYGLNYYAAFEGCSSDISWTPATTLELAAKLDSLSKKYVFMTESSDGELARLVISTSNYGGKAVVLDSMQTVSKKQAETKSYVGIMSENILVLEGIFAQ